MDAPMADNASGAAPSRSSSSTPPIPSTLPTNHPVGINNSKTSLNADGYREILDVIDRLRQHGLNRYVDLPQIIVCGDQSCGKSSALEAISGMSFPSKDTLCTRFATELILRRSSRCGIDIKIIPNPHRSTAEKERLQAFSYTVTEELDLARVIEEAKGAMCLNGGSKVFSTDVLHVEISGPNQPHLTLVDLPGLFLAGNKDQSEQDAEMVEKLVLSYMSNPRTIILAVVSAKSDFAVQQVTRLARSQDPRGSRTMGLITKPDTLDRGSESERFYVELAQNKDVKFQLGWHVLRNRSFAERNASPAVRDANEEAFFASGVWASALKPDQLGAAALRVRLSKVLWQQIMRQLPAVNDDVMKGIDECRAILSRLGPARVTTDDKRHYLLHVSSRFSELAKAAVDGIYTDPFFRTSRSHRLRAIVQNTLSAFAREISLNGHAVTIVEDDEVLEVRPGGMEVDDERRKITRAAFIESVRELMRESRGRELPGTYKPLIVAELFSKQCKPWQGMVRKLQEKVFQTAVEVVTAMLGNTMGDAGAAQRLFHQVLKPALMSLKVDLQVKAAEILRPHLSGHPITYDPSLMENVRQAQVVRRRQQMEQRVKQFFQATMLPFGICTHKFDMHRLLDELANVAEPDMDTYSCSLAVEAYYKVALRNLIDALSTLAIEGTFIQRIPSIFTPQTVCGLDNGVVEYVASESPEAAAERAQATAKLAVLEEALVELHRCGSFVAGFGSAGMSAGLGGPPDVAGRRHGTQQQQQQQRSGAGASGGEVAMDL